jgi:hypothetical protein
MKNQRAFIILILFFLCCGVHSLFAQQAGDYRSSGSGNWNDAANWEVYDGTSWVAATNYPGEVAGTNLVYIQGGNTISLGTAIPSGIQGLIVGDGTGGTDTLQVSGNSSLNTPVIDIQTGGFAIWTANVTLTIPAGAAFKITGGTLDNGTPCSAAKRLVIGTSIFATCNGAAGADYSFSDLINGGGSVAVTPSSNSPVCEGSDLNLFSNPSGAGSSGATYSWTGTGPGGYSFTSTAQDPVESGLAAGSYSYTVTITDTFGNTNSDSVSAEVETAAAFTLQPSDQQGPPGGVVVFNVTASAAASYQWQVSSDGGGSFTNISDGGRFTGSQTNTLQVDNLQASDEGNLFRVVIQPTSASCPQLTSDAALLSIVVNTVITNRRITYRVNN